MFLHSDWQETKLEPSDNTFIWKFNNEEIIESIKKIFQDFV